MDLRAASPAGPAPIMQMVLGNFPCAYDRYHYVISHKSSVAYQVPKPPSPKIDNDRMGLSVLFVFMDAFILKTRVANS